MSTMVPSSSVPCKEGITDRPDRLATHDAVVHGAQTAGRQVQSYSKIQGCAGFTAGTGVSKQMQIWVTPDSASSATDCPSMTCQQLHLVTDSQTLRLPARQSDRCSLSMWAPYLMPITWQMARQWFQYSDQCTTATFFVFTAAATLIWHAGGRASHIADKRLGWPTCSAYTEHLACKQHLVAAAAPRDLTAALHSQP